MVAGARNLAGAAKQGNTDRSEASLLKNQAQWCMPSSAHEVT